MELESECTFTYKTVRAYKAFEDYIKEKLKTKTNEKGIIEGYLIEKNYIDNEFNLVSVIFVYSIEDIINYFSYIIKFNFSISN